MIETVREIKSRPIWWQDKRGAVHVCEGAHVHPGVFLLWTLCERDVPANAAHHPEPSERATCAECIAAPLPAPPSKTEA